MKTKIQEYLQRNFRIFKWNGPAWLWFLGLFGAIIGLGVVSYGILELIFSIKGNHGEFLIFLVFGLIALLFVSFFSLILYVIFPSYKQFLIFTLILSGTCFAVNSYVLNHEVFPPFTERTVWALWIAFLLLGASVFIDRIPKTILPFFQPILILGAYLSLAFVLVLAPLMTFSWALVWMAGLGFLPYGPLFAMIAFIYSIFIIHTKLENGKRRISFVLITASIVFLLGYSSYYFIQWNHADGILTKPETLQGHNRVDVDLPEWIQKAGRLRVNHVTEMVLQPNRRSQMGMFASQSQFDPLAYFASQGFLSLFRTEQQPKITPEDSGRILHLLFGRSHAYLERLWRGNSLITTDIDSHVQVYPELRVSYTETTISIYNENSSSDRSFLKFGSMFATPEEAIYTITVPPGSICTKLSLWVNGEERPARLTFKSTARNAYETIVGTERRDPSYVEWLDGNRLRLRVFPVNPEDYRMVRIGIVSPLQSDGKTLTYDRIRLEGPISDFADQKVNVDLFTSSQMDLETSGISLKEKVVSDSQVRQWAGKGGFLGWSFSFPETPAKGTVSAGGMSYNVLPEQRESFLFQPDGMIVVLNEALSRSDWKKLVKKLYEFKIPVTIITNEWFQTKDSEKAMRYLDECEIPAFNLFPLHLSEIVAAQNIGENPIWIVAGETQSIPFGELRGSERFKNMQRSAQNRDVIPKFAIINGKKSEYVASLIDLEKILPVAENENELFEILKNRKVLLPIQNEKTVSLPYAKLTLEKTDQTDVKRPGGDLLIRMLIRKKIMRQLGKRFFDKDLENQDLVEMARDAMVVSPVSTLIVLESEDDYKRFGIKSEPSALGQSKLEAPGAVPEPGEWILILCVLSGLIVYFRFQKRHSFF
ncbi:XrtN system VIT domain-containing protein [Leptospira sp. 201903071]|uniref:XrtN system VIT domain-containing protein n=1 Tax=Leptospira ainazelensis TaxID=2810034 RepID=UPI001962574A|nr:XrtN system VIT domain-containing protein [Leptospira ainazelensis]MBM9502620.1 XrtN system VIT domain-containing protein [Leptospira ainazelensis]